MIEFDPAAWITVFDYAGLKDYIGPLLGGTVDVVNRDALKPYVKPAATADAVYAFSPENPGNPLIPSPAGTRNFHHSLSAAGR
jgi:hypothetical protein